MSSSTRTSPLQAEKDVEEAEETNPELYQHFANLVSSLPASEGLSNNQFYRHDQGWYCSLVPIVGAMVADACFTARPSDIIVATLPKSGTTWIKSLLYATVHRREHHPADAADHPFNSIGPHECIKFFEYQLYTWNKVPDLDKLPDPRLFATHHPFVSLPRTIAASGCKIVYVCRDPKDHLISQCDFVNKFRAMNQLEPFSVEAAAELFCSGLSPFGPYWEHVLGYWRAHLARPEQVLFFRLIIPKEVEVLQSEWVTIGNPKLYQPEHLEGKHEELNPQSLQFFSTEHWSLFCWARLETTSDKGGGGDVAAACDAGGQCDEVRDENA